MTREVPARFVVVDDDAGRLAEAVALARTFGGLVLGLRSPITAAELVLSQRIAALAIAKAMRALDGEFVCRAVRERWAEQRAATVLMIDRGTEHDARSADAVLVRPYAGIDFARALASAMAASAERQSLTLAPLAKTGEPAVRKRSA